jgi:hypothetical protein
MVVVLCSGGSAGEEDARRSCCTIPVVDVDVDTLASGCGLEGALTHSSGLALALGTDECTNEHARPTP